MEIEHKKNTALHLAVPMVDSSSPAGFKTGLSPADTAYYKDGTGSWTSLTITDTFSEIGSTGVYEIDLTAAEANHDQIIIKVTAAGAYDNLITINLTAEDANIWHVAKSGNDNNSGHCLSRAKLTIGAAMSAAANGDTIIIHPGTYTENVTTVGKTGITIEGVSRSSVLINPTTGCGVAVTDGCTVRNVTVSAPEAALVFGIAIQVDADNVTVENVSAFGHYNGIDIASGGYGRNIVVRNSYFSGHGSGGEFSSNGLIIENCQFYTDSTYNTSTVGYGLAIAGFATVRNCVMTVTRTSVSAYDAVAFFASTASVSMDNCQFYVLGDEGAGNWTGDAYGVKADSVSNVTLLNCAGLLYSGGNAGQESTGIKNVDGDSSVLTLNTKFISYDTAFTQTSGAVSSIQSELDNGGRIDTLIDGIKMKTDNLPASPAAVGSAMTLTSAYDAAKDAASQSSVDTIATNSAVAALAAKVITNKAIQNKITGAIVYYDDDGVTPVLAHSPVETESDIERAVG